MSRFVNWIALVVVAIGGVSFSTVEAQVRDAGSKIRGETNFFESARPQYSARAVTPSRRMTAPAIVRSQPITPSAPSTVAQAPTGRRSFSYEAAPPAPASQGVRRYSYDPQMGETRSIHRSRAQQLPGYLRANKKILGDY